MVLVDNPSLKWIVIVVPSDEISAWSKSLLCPEGVITSGCSVLNFSIKAVFSVSVKWRTSSTYVCDKSFTVLRSLCGFIIKVNV